MDGAGPDDARALGSLLLGEEPSLTRVQVAERAGVPLDLAVTLWHQLGFPHRDDHDVAFAESDVEALRLSAELVRIGILSPESQAALVRTWGRSYARLAEWQTTLLAGLAAGDRHPDGHPDDDPDDDPDGDPGTGPGTGPPGLPELVSEVLPRVEALQTYVWRRHLASAAEHLLEDTGTLTTTESQLSVCFVDIVGYTTQSRSLDGSALVRWVDGFEQGTTALVVDHGGQVIKTIGDEVLFTVADPAAAVGVALALAARGADEDDPFPAVRAGIAHGSVVRRLGDVFGSTVNAASRLTSAARAGSVLVDTGVHEALASDDEDRWRFRRARRISAKGFTNLEAWRVRTGGSG